MSLYEPMYADHVHPYKVSHVEDGILWQDNVRFHKAENIPYWLGEHDHDFQVPLNSTELDLSAPIICLMYCRYLETTCNVLIVSEQTCILPNVLILVMFYFICMNCSALWFSHNHPTQVILQPIISV